MDTLTPQEVAKLTGKPRPVQQVAVLVRRGIPFRFGAGEVAVARAVAEQLPSWQAQQEAARPRMDMIR